MPESLIRIDILKAFQIIETVDNDNVIEGLKLKKHLNNPHPKLALIKLSEQN